MATSMWSAILGGYIKRTRARRGYSRTFWYLKSSN